MDRKGICWGCYGLLMLLLWFVPAYADETADDITDMMAWWDNVGHDWDEADELMQFASTGLVYVLADNTLEKSDESQ